MTNSAKFWPVVPVVLQLLRPELLPPPTPTTETLRVGTHTAEVSEPHGDIKRMLKNGARVSRNNTLPDSKVHGANMGPTWVLSVPDGPHVGPMNLAIRAGNQELSWCRLRHHWGHRCRHDNLWGHQWRHSWHHDNFRFLVIRHVTLAVITWTDIPAAWVKSLQLIGRSDTLRWNLRVPNLEMSCSDLTKCRETRIVAAGTVAGWYAPLG